MQSRKNIRDVKSKQKQWANCCVVNNCTVFNLLLLACAVKISATIMEAEKKASGESSLNDSWVELHFGTSAPGSGLISRGDSDTTDAFLPTTDPRNLEKLLLEAQKESGDASRAGSTVPSRASPKTPHSPASPEKETGATQLGVAAGVDNTNDWVYDWSSRIEVIPPRGLAGKMKHPVRSTPLSVRKSGLMRNSMWTWDNLPALLLSHACTFLVGAAAMFVYLKKYCKWASPGASLAVD